MVPLTGFIEFQKDLRSESNISFNTPINYTKTKKYNMIIKDYEPDVYNFRTIITYTYVIPSTAASTRSPEAIDQDVEVNIQIFGENKKTKEEIGYIEFNKLYYNIPRSEIESPLFLSSILSAKYTIITSKQGIFKNITQLETKIPSDERIPTYWGLFFN